MRLSIACTVLIEFIISISYYRTITISYDQMIETSQHQMVEVIFGAKSRSKTQIDSFTPSAKDRREKTNKLQAMTFDEEYASDAPKITAPPKHRHAICKIRFRG